MVLTPLCCQNEEYRGTGRRYGVSYNSANISVHGASIMVLGLLKKKWTEEEEKKELVLTVKQHLVILHFKPP